jgi:hypothetical protein
MHALLPAHLRDVKDSGMAAARAVWLRQATIPSTPTVTPSLPTSTVQRVWDDVCCKLQSDTLLDDAVDHVVRARLLAARSQGSGDWLDALPLSSVTQVPWRRGRRLAWYATCPDAFTVSHAQSGSTHAGSAVAVAESKKIEIYADQY